MVTIKMVSERCGLSVSAVSKAMNGQPGISPERAEGVRRIAAEIGYYPNAAARALKTNHSQNLGLIYQNDMAHEYFALVMEGIREAAGQHQYDLTLLCTPEDPVMDYYEHARQRSCDGVILAQNYIPIEQIDHLVHSSLPLVSIEASFPGHSSVTTENETSLMQLVQYLAHMGHRRIAYIYGDMGDTTRERLEGFRSGCEKYGLQIPEEYLIAGKFHNPAVAGRATRRLMALPTPPTCILYPDDVSYLGGKAKLEDLGLTVGEDISCVGYDGLQITSLMRPSLTSYRQNAKEIGRIAVEDLIFAIENPKNFVPQTYRVTGQIQFGNTVKNLNENEEG
ncbi:MAG: LacI family transcriptional regulator [Firmicutes bacterium]|nr:LacI family transcriptional regulator [Bacillota bacterium]